MFTFENVPLIPPYDEGEVAIPRTNLATFDRKFVNGQPRQNIDYVYRMSACKSSYGSSFEKLRRQGFEYKNPLDNIEKHRGRNLPYINQILEKIAPRENGRVISKGLYFYSSLEAALRNQYFNLSVNPRFKIDSNGNVLANSDKDCLLEHLWILTRVSVKAIPEGVFFADPNTQDTPDAIVHVVDEIGGDVIIINPNLIEVSIESEFIPVTGIDNNLAKDAVFIDNNISKIIRRILPIVES